MYRLNWAALMTLSLAMASCDTAGGEVSLHVGPQFTGNATEGAPLGIADGAFLSGMGDEGRLAMFSSRGVLANSGVVQDSMGNIGMGPAHPLGGNLSVSGNLEAYSPLTDSRRGLKLTDPLGSAHILSGGTFSHGLGFYTNSDTTNTRLFISDAGNVGIGADNLPGIAGWGRALTIWAPTPDMLNPSTNSGVELVGNVSSANVAIGGLTFHNRQVQAKDNRVAQFYAVAEDPFVDPAAAALAFTTFGAERMRLTSKGFLGIGATNPQDTLEVRSSSTGGIRLSQAGQPYYHQIRNNGDGLLFSADDGNSGGPGADIRFLTKGVEKVRIDSAGNVGIGTIAPAAVLDVAGSVKSTIGVQNGSVIARAGSHSAYLIVVSSNYNAGNAVRSAMYHVTLNQEGTAVAFQDAFGNHNQQDATFSVVLGMLVIAGLPNGNHKVAVFGN